VIDDGRTITLPRVIALWRISLRWRIGLNGRVVLRESLSSPLRAKSLVPRWDLRCGKPFPLVPSRKGGSIQGKNQPGTRRIQDEALATKRVPYGTIQLSLRLGFPRRPLSAGTNRRHRPKASDAAHAFDPRPLLFKRLAAGRFAELYGRTLNVVALPRQGVVILHYR